MKQSAGILLYKIEKAASKFLLVHPGGPFFKNKDAGAWTIPKGELHEGEDPLAAAKREFLEETGHEISEKCLPLNPIKQKSGKFVYAWACRSDFDPAKLLSNTFEMEWPPRSGKMKSFPEIDKAQWFAKEEALLKILPAQQPFILELDELIKKM